MTTPYVGEEAAQRASVLENKFLTLPHGLEVLVFFVGVEATPVAGGDSRHFIVHLGIDRKYSVQMGELLIKQVLKKEIEEGLTITSFVSRGVRTR